MVDAVAIDLSRKRQAEVGAEIADAKRLIQSTQTASDEVYGRLERIIELLQLAERLYNAVEPAAKAELSSTVSTPSTSTATGTPTVRWSQTRP